MSKCPRGKLRGISETDARSSGLGSTRVPRVGLDVPPEPSEPLSARRVRSPDRLDARSPKLSSSPSRPSVQTSSLRSRLPEFSIQKRFQQYRSRVTYDAGLCAPLIRRCTMAAATATVLLTRLCCSASHHDTKKPALEDGFQRTTVTDRFRPLNQRWPGHCLCAASRTCARSCAHSPSPHTARRSRLRPGRP